MENEYNKIHVGILKLNSNAKIPSYSHDDDACMDIIATSFEFDVKKNCYVYHTGLAIDIPKGYEMQIRPRSSIRNYDVYLTNSPGTVDCGYHGEVLVCFKNHFSIKDRLKINKIEKLLEKIIISNKSEEDIENNKKQLLEIANISDDEIINYAMLNAPFNVGEKISQIKITTCPRVSFNEVTSLNETERGTNGFGSTGK